MIKSPKHIRCAVYTRKSTEEGLQQSYNSLHAQRDACEAYIRSQAHEGWILVTTSYDDGGHSGGTMERPALRQLLHDIQQNRIDAVVVYKVDRLTRSLRDFAKIIDIFEAHEVSFVSITQSFSTTNSMGRLTLNEHHPSLTVRQLLKWRIPLSWEEQRRTFFPPANRGE